MTTGTVGAAWRLATGPVAATGCDVDVWRVGLIRSPASLAALEGTLSPDERERAARFHFDRDRRRYICARGALRIILGESLSARPSDLAFRYGPNGKPALSGRFDGARAFNVSHSGELALIAVARDIELGVDVEAVRTMEDADDVAARFFSPREVACLRALPDAQRRDAFFTCWTRKEAYLKALGSGLAKPLDAFDVTFAPGEPARLVVCGDEQETSRWSLRELQPGSGYAGALVVERAAGGVRCWTWMEACASLAGAPDEDSLKEDV